MILFDLTTFCRSVTGAGVGWAELIRRFPKLMPNDFKLVAYLPENHSLPLDMEALSGFQVNVSIPRGRYLKYIPSFIRAGNRDVLHMGHYQNYPLFPGKKVVTVHDFTYEKYFSWHRRWTHGFLQRRAISSADIIHCVSETTKQDLLYYYPNVVDRDIRVISSAAGDGFYQDPSAASESRAPYLLWVGKRAGYKNFAGALGCLDHLNKTGRPMKLIVAGAPLTMTERKSAEDLGLTEYIESRVSVTDDQLRRLYSDAVALLYLSRHEGFGLPILEAQKSGCPVVCIRAPGCMEIGGDSVLYVNGEGFGNIEVLLDRLQETESRKKIIDAGLENAKRYDWDRSAREMVKLYIGLHGPSEEVSK